MPIELECKIPVDDFAAVRERLAALGAVEEREVHERNWLFDTPDGKLIASSCLLRLRRFGEEKGGRITVKRPAPEVAFKSREETEASFDTAEDAEGVLRALGYDVAYFYEKLRNAWRYRGCEIALDRLPEIGAFVEVEGPDEETIRGVLDALGLDPQEHVADNYRVLFERQREKNGHPRGGAMRFDAPAPAPARPPSVREAPRLRNEKEH